MVLVLRRIYDILHKLYEDHRDPRVQHLPLVGNPLPVLIVIVAYLLFVLHYGPKLMERRKAFELKYIMRCYNGLQVIANLFLFIVGVPNSYLRSEFSLTCQRIDHTNNAPWMQRLIYISYCYYLTKYLDLFDTIFIVLRKKNNQITFLHVYHHAGMIFGVYVFMTFLAGSHSTMLGVINLFIHSVMYLYYFVTSVRPIKQALWWKRHITQLQLLQFGYLIVHFIMVLVWNDCNHPNIISIVGLTQNLFMFALFFDFYLRAYVRKSSSIKNKIATTATTTAKTTMASVNHTTTLQTDAPDTTNITQHQQQQKQQKQQADSYPVTLSMNLTTKTTTTGTRTTSTVAAAAASAETSTAAATAALKQKQS